MLIINNDNSSNNKKLERLRDAQQFRVLVALVEVQPPTPTCQFTAVFVSSSRESNVLFTSRHQIFMHICR